MRYKHEMNRRSKKIAVKGTGDLNEDESDDDLSSMQLTDKVRRTLEG